VSREPTSVTIGVVAFSDSGVSVQTPTNDQATVIAAIDRLGPTRNIRGRGHSRFTQVIAVAEAGPYAVDYYTNQGRAFAYTVAHADTGAVRNPRSCGHHPAERR